jgi:hypothetical protein
MGLAWPASRNHGKRGAGPSLAWVLLREEQMAETGAFSKEAQDLQPLA